MHMHTHKQQPHPACHNLALVTVPRALCHVTCRNFGAFPGTFTTEACLVAVVSSMVVSVTRSWWHQIA